MKNTPFPSGGLVFTGTTGIHNGGDGAWRASVDLGNYWVGVTFGGSVVWSYHSVVAPLSGGIALSGSITLLSPGLLELRSPPVATANYGVLNLGDGLFSGAAGAFSGHAQGTYFAHNAAEGFQGKLFDLQRGGKSQFNVDAGGNTAITSGALTVARGNLAVNRGNVTVASGNLTLGAGSLALSGTNALVNLSGRFKIHTDNAGTPAHTPSGPNLYITDAVSGLVRLTLRSIGELAVILQDDSLGTAEVSHGIQIFHKSRGVNQTQVGFGTGLQIFLTDLADQVQEAGNLQCGLMANTSGAISTYIQLCCRNAGSFVQSILGFHTGEVRIAKSSGGWLTTPFFTASASHGQLNFGNTLFDGAAGHFTGLVGGTGLAANFDDTFTGRFMDIQREGVSLWRVGNTGAQVVTVQDDQTTGANQAFQLDHILTTGTPGVGFGTAILMRGLDVAGTQVSLCELRSTQSTAATGLVSSNVLFRHSVSGSMTTALEIQTDNNVLVSKKLIVTEGLAVANSATGSSLGSVTKKVEIFDEAGTSLGFLPVYNSIT